MNLLLLSNSSSDAGYLVHAHDEIRAVLDGVGPDAAAVFIPYAGVTREWDDYADIVADAFEPLGLKITSAHRAGDPATAVRQAKVIIVGGGNTFNLLHHVRALGLLTAVQDAVKGGAAYIGWSAGSNLACPTVRTTNDMPIIDPAGFDALGLVSFQINAHYTDAHPAGHRGETRRQRLAEFCRINPATGVLGLPEGSGLRVTPFGYTLCGPHDAVWFLGEAEPLALAPGELSTARFLI